MKKFKKRSLPSLGRTRKGAAMLDYGLLAGLIALASIASVLIFSDRLDNTMCRASNALGIVNDYFDETCPTEEPIEPGDVGFDPSGFVDLYLDTAEVELRRVLLPVENFDITGLSEVHVATDRPDSVSACYLSKNGQFTCASMQGLESAFDFPPNVVAVGYQILPVQEPRLKMEQPVSITLGSLEDPSLNQTWNIHVHRSPTENLFEPDMNFESIAYPAGEIGEQKIIQALNGSFSDEDLIFTLTPTDGQFATCQKDYPRGDVGCGLLTSDQISTTINPNGVSLGYQFMLPRDVRVPVSWPVKVSLASTFDESITQDWDVVISREAGEAPAFHDLPFENISYPADTWDWTYSYVPLDQSYPSDLLVTTPQAEPGLKICYQRAEEGPTVCSSDVGDGDVEFIIPAGVFSLGLSSNLPENVLIAYVRDEPTSFKVESVDYPDFFEDFMLTIDRPAFFPIFEPQIVFEDQVFPQGDINWHPVLAEMAGEFNSDSLLVIAAGQPKAKACFKGTEENPDARIVCSEPSEDGESIVTVPLGAKQVGFSVDFGDSPFQPFDETINFELRNAKDPSLRQAYSVNVVRPNIPVVFTPDMEAMPLPDVSYPEETEDWQDAVLVPLAGEFNTDLTLSMTGGVNDAAVCYQSAQGATAVCSQSAIDGPQDITVPHGSYAVGYSIHLSDDIYLEQDMAIEIVMKSAETDEYAVTLQAQATRDQVPVLFDPNLGFRDKKFDRGTFAETHLMVPIEGEITTGLTMIVPQTNFWFRACYTKAAGEKPTCSSDAQYGDVSLDVPQESASVGYQVFLPQDVHIDWENDVSFRVMSDYDESLDYDVSIALSRETIPASFSPDTVFEDITFPAGTTGDQDVIKAITGDVETGTRVLIARTDFDIFTCIQKYSTGNPSCTENAADGDAKQQAAWGETEVKQGKRLIHAAGYRVVLPDNIHEDVDWAVSLRLQSTYDDNRWQDYSFRIKRPSVDVIWQPDQAMTLPDTDFPERASGPHDILIPFSGNFTTDTDYTIGQTGSPISPCYAESDNTDTTCGKETVSGNATVTLETDFSGIGYRIDLPTDLAEPVNKTVQVDLRSAYDPSLSQTQSFRIYRQPAPVVFNPTVAFQDREFINGETGWQRDMERLSGDLTTTMYLHASGGQKLKLCVQDGIDDDVRCTAEAKADIAIDVAPTAYAIGYEVELPDNVRTRDEKSISFKLHMKDFPSQFHTYQINTLREIPDDMVFEPTVTFQNASMPTEWSGWTPFTVPLTGDFSGDLELVLTEADADLKPCVQSQSNGSVTCDPAPASGIIPLPRSTYAFGYAVNIHEDPFAPYSRRVKLRLQSAEIQGLGQNYNPTVTRPALPVELPRGLFAKTHEFVEADSGEKIVMAQINGAGNTPMRFEINSANFDIRPCIQESAQDPVSCSPQSAQAGKQSFDISSETYAVGYRTILPEDHFAAFNHSFAMRIVSETIEDADVVYPVTLSRPVQDPIMPAENIFPDTSYRPGTAGEQEVMVVLDPRIDTPLRLSKGFGHRDLSVCYQLGRNSEVVCQGQGSEEAAEVIDENDNWYAFGYRFILDQNTDNDVARFLPLTATSVWVPQARVTYNVGISRMKLNAVMPDRTLFGDRTYEEGENGEKTIMVPLAQDVNVDLALHKAAGQEGLQICYQIEQAVKPSCFGGGISEAHSIQVKQDYYAVGYKFDLGSQYEEFAETFNLHLTAADGWSNRVDYQLDIFRPSKPIILPPQGLFSDVVLDEEEHGSQLITVSLQGQGNTDLEMIKPAGQAGLELCHQATQSDTLTCSGKNNAGEVIRQIPQGAYKIGYQFMAGDTAYEEYQDVFSITLRVKGAETEKVTYNINVTRPAKHIQMPSAALFQDIEYPAGTTGVQYEMKDITGQINGDMLMINAAEKGGYKLCREEGGSNTRICPRTTHGAEQTVMDFSVSHSKIGFGVPLPTDDADDYENVFNFELVSKDYSQARQAYSVRVTRPGTNEVIPIENLFTDVEIPSSATGNYEVMKNISGLISADMRLRASPDITGYSLCLVDAEGESSCPKKTRQNYNTDLDFPADTQEIGFTVPLSDDVFETFDKNFSFEIFAADGSGETYSYNIRIHRPAEEIKVTPADLFVDVEVPVNTTGVHHVWKDIDGLINSDMILRGHPNGIDFGLCLESQSGVQFCPRETYSGGYQSVDVAKTSRKIGFRAPMPSNVYDTFDKTLTFSFLSTEDSSKSRTYTVRIHRPGAEIKVLPANLFSDVSFPAETTGTQYAVKNVEGLISSDMEIRTFRQPNVFSLCHNFDGRDDPYCPTQVYSAGTSTLEVRQKDTHLGVSVALPSDVYEEFDKTITFTVRSVEDTTKSQEYTVRFYRPGKEIKVLPADLFTDVDIPVETTGVIYAVKDIQGLISSNMEVLAYRQSADFNLCRNYESRTASFPYCPVDAHPNYSMSLEVPMSDTQLGVSVDLPSNVYQEYDRSITFAVRSKEDISKRQDYTVRFHRPGKEIKVTPAGLFQDVVIPAGTTGTYYEMKDLEGLITSNMELMTSRQPVDFSLCRNYGDRTVPHCPTTAHPSVNRNMNFYMSDTQVGLGVALPSNINIAFDRTITFAIRSVEDISKRQDYTVRFQRPAAN